jgi:hypothetical protein
MHMGGRGCTHRAAPGGGGGAAPPGAGPPLWGWTPMQGLGRAGELRAHTGKGIS